MLAAPRVDVPSSPRLTSSLPVQRPPAADPRRWTAASMLAAAVATFAVTVTVAVVWLLIVTPGDRVLMRSPGGLPWSMGRPFVVVGELRARPSDLRVGDEVLTIDGRDAGTWGLALVHPPPDLRPWKVGETVRYEIRRDGATRTVDVPVDVLSDTLSDAPWAEFATRLIALGVAVLIFLRRPWLPASRALLIYAAAFMGTVWIGGFTTQVHPLFGPIGAPAYLLVFLGNPLMYTAILHAAIVFPRPRPSPVVAWTVRLIYGVPAVLCGCYLYRIRDGAPTSGVWAFIFETVIYIVRYGYPIATIGVVGWRYMTEQDPRARIQIRWVGWSLSLALVLQLVVYVLPAQVNAPPLVDVRYQPLLTVLPLVAVTVAIVRYQAFDVDTLVNRSLVWAGLTAIAAVVYGGALVVLGLLFERQVRPRLLPTLLATGLVAVALQPVHRRLQRAVNHWMYGSRDDPADVFARLGRHLEAVEAPKSALDTLVSTVAQTLKFPYVAVELDGPDGMRVTNSYGRPKGGLIALSLGGTRPVGRLVVATGTPSRTLAARHRRLLEALAERAAAAVQAVRLSADLERSRAELERAHSQLVRAREEERRRLRRDLHDGVGPLLAGMAMQVEGARNLLRREPEASDRLLGAVGTELDTAMADIRRVIEDLQPTPLDQLGLVGALRAAAARFSTQPDGGDPSGLVVTVQAPDQLPTLPAAIELAVYQIATEALANTARHASARHCLIRLSSDSQVHLDVLDDGRGEPSDQTASGGVGLPSMAQRARDLGGSFDIEFRPGVGTTVRACIPLAERHG